MEEVYRFLKEDMRLVVIVLITLAVTFALAILVNRFAAKTIKRLSEKEDFDPTNYRFLQRFLVALIFMVGVSLCIYMIPGMRHIANTVITGAGILALVVGFASQQALANLISGALIAITKPYRINDRITIRDTLSGVVEDITLRHTVIRNFENRRIIIPNSIMSNEVVINSNYSDDLICRFIEVGIAYSADVKKAKVIMKDEVLKHPYFVDPRTDKQKADGDEVVPVRVLSMGDFSVNLRAWSWASDPGKAFVMGCDLLESIKERFDAEGVEIPFPYRNLIIKGQGQDKTQELPLK